jgi:opine dehydrogenase
LAAVIKTIAILGAGHGGCAAAADLTLRGFSVRLHARNADRLAPLHAVGGVEVRGVHQGLVRLQSMTTRIEEAVEGADLVILVVPSVAHEAYAAALAPLISPELPIFLNPGHTGGGLHFVQELRNAGYIGPVQTCETVTLTYICRMESPTIVHIYSYIKQLAFAAFPGKNAQRLYQLLKPIYAEITPASNVLETALTNLNAIFHPPGMIMNAGWIERTAGDFLFYRDGITDSIGRVTEAVDAEKITVAQALGIPAQTFLDAFYRAGLTTKEAHDSGSIARACQESEPNKFIKSPPSLNHRYIKEDVGYGLVPISAFGMLAGVKTPTIDALIELCGAATGINFRATGLTLEKMGLAHCSRDRLAAFLNDGSL